jgi:hypothetical protein
MIWYSIDTFDSEKFKSRRGYDLEQVLKNLLVSPCPTGINQVIDSTITIAEQIEIKKFCKENNLSYSSARIENWHSDVSDPNVIKDREINGPIEKRFAHCRWGKDSFYYDALGRVHPCCIRMNEEYAECVPNEIICRMCPD